MNAVLAMLDASNAQQVTNQAQAGLEKPQSRKHLPNPNIAEAGKSTRFQKGKSGNPGGRPKKQMDLAQEAQKHAAVAIKTLVDVMSNEETPPPSRISAASELLDRGFGRAPQSIDMNHVHSLSDEFEAFIRRLNAAETGDPQALIANDVQDADFSEVEDD